MLSKTSARIAAAAVVALIAAGAAWALGAFASPQRYAACVVADVSGSTVVARPSYLNAFSVFALDAGLHGSGDMWVVLAAGNPGIDGAPVYTSVKPDHPGDSTLAPGEVRGYVATATEGLRRALVDPPVSGGGSAIAEATLQCAKVLRGGDRLQLLSDGIQSSPQTGDFHDVDLSAAGIDGLLSTLEGRGLLPDLRGVRVEAPLLIQHTAGTNIPEDRQQQIVGFWRAWAVRVHATPVGTLAAQGP
jgi:hypothetical protein